MVFRSTPPTNLFVRVIIYRGHTGELQRDSTWQLDFWKIFLSVSGRDKESIFSDTRLAVRLRIGLFVLMVFSSTQGVEIPRRVLKAVFPVFLAGDKTPSAVIHIGRIERTFQRKGYFRVALLPEVIVQNIEATIRHPDDGEVILIGIDKTLRGIAAKMPMSFEGLALSLKGESVPRLRAVKCDLATEGCWLLVDANVQTETGLQHFDQVILNLRGPKAGFLEVQSQPKQVFRLFPEREANSN